LITHSSDNKNTKQIYKISLIITSFLIILALSFFIFNNYLDNEEKGTDLKYQEKEIDLETKNK
jgi:hypothetical protein